MQEHLKVRKRVFVFDIGYIIYARGCVMKNDKISKKFVIIMSSAIGVLVVSFVVLMLLCILSV